jgi:hypothetical protein
LQVALDKLQVALDKLQVTQKVGTGNLASQLVKFASQLVQVSLQISRLQAHEITVKCDSRNFC